MARVQINQETISISYQHVSHLQYIRPDCCSHPKLSPNLAVIFIWYEFIKTDCWHLKRLSAEQNKNKRNIEIEHFCGVTSCNKLDITQYARHTYREWIFRCGTIDLRVEVVTKANCFGGHAIVAIHVWHVASVAVVDRLLMIIVG